MYIYADRIKRQLIKMLSDAALLVLGEGNILILMRHESKEPAFRRQNISTTQDDKLVATAI
jgi:hypothetical protein